MSAPPRGLSAEEALLWAKLAQSVTPLPGRRRPKVPTHVVSPVTAAPAPPKAAPKAPVVRPAAVPLATRPAVQPGLDSHWERRIKGGALVPDFTLDLHGHTLDTAYTRVMDGMMQARAMGARVVLVIAGKSRPVEAADRSGSRGAIRAKLLDWLAASSHGSAIAAIRKAHIRHGGEGALYIVLKRAG